MRHQEIHRTHRTGWLRASVLGANDGILSTSSLMMGVAAAGATTGGILAAGIAGLVAGAMSMAAGEYVSVCSQADTEKADTNREAKELAENIEHEHTELRDIYIKRGLDKQLATEVATQLMQHDALGAHLRDELGITEALTAKPLQAAIASATTFAIGAILPVLVVIILPPSILIVGIAISTLLLLSVLGYLAAKTGGAPIMNSILRVTFWGALAMGATTIVGSFFGVAS